MDHDYALTRKVGDTYPVPLRASKNKSTINISGWSSVLSVTSAEENYEAENIVFEIPLILTNPSVGEGHFAPTPENVSASGEFFFKAVLTDAEGYKYTPASGTFRIT